MYMHVHLDLHVDVDQLKNISNKNVAMKLFVTQIKLPYFAFVFKLVNISKCCSLKHIHVAGMAFYVTLFS